jgi:CheY-like chemotaxis protein
LSISREIASLLGGEVRLTSSAPGLGSTFTLFLPITFSSKGVEPQSRAKQDQIPALTFEPAETSMQWEIEDDRQHIEPGDRVLLIVEDDLNFAKILLDKAHEREFKALVARRGENALAMAREIRPDAITLDLGLPDVDGWTVLDRLKNDLATRHIPIHIISALDGRQRGLKLGAVSYLQKPVTEEALSQALSDIRQFIERGVRNLLVVEDDEAQRNSIVELIGNGDVVTKAVGTGEEALALLKERHFDCLVLDLGLPDMTGFELIERIKSEAGLQELPIIIYTGKELSKSDETELRRMAETIIIKDVQSPERLLDETALFLHRVEVNLPEAKRRVLHQLHQTDAVLAGKKALIVDDDVRNIFALTSALENVQMAVLYSENGRDALSLLEATPDIDVVLMDVMMPEMDGYETMRAIRKMERFRSLPIIALTAKAMKGDREKCVEAGASDYISKPANIDQLLSLLRVWLYR